MTRAAGGVLHVDSATEWRGGQQQLAHLLRARPQDRWAGVPDSPLAARVGAPHVPLYPNNDPRNALLLRRAEAALIAAHTPHAHGLALFAGRPLVVHRRVDFRPRHLWKYRRADRIIAVSRRVGEILHAAGLPSALIRVVHDGVDPLPAAPPSLDSSLDSSLDLPRPRYGAVGALVDHKGHTHLITAMKDVPGSLIIAGEGPLRERLQAQIHAAGLAGRVFLLGQRADVAGIFASLDVFVHPSVEEGLGQVIIEAMHAGLPIVATTAGGVPELLADPEPLPGALLVPPGQPAALAAALAAALHLPRGQLTKRAQAFCVAAMVDATAAVYAELLG